MLFALSVLDFRCKDTKFPRQIEQFFPFFSPFNILCRLLSHTQLTELRPNGYENCDSARAELSLLKLCRA